LFLLTFVIIVVIIARFSSQKVKTVNTNPEVVGCNEDWECKVGGCNGELCYNTYSEYDLDFSTCVWKDEYICREFASCSCVDNKCQWQPTAEYLQCLKELTPPLPTIPDMDVPVGE